ncbi:helix-turn-helix domain-containing protein [Prescottella equi]|uniref:helix-turn-helix domain-containing protein n=1 Tax=Rhodococcus hoagii TaxID=43767 RepID=UPI001A03A5D5|nr:helix-turn-helix transcriptional regulator [Prescottella equi]MBM4580873.1 helix-turn-helix domain-containing protein [Prescottella equi]MBM4580888.1 helix-turn-helix domain-containing protein [Prescottella equi]MBM4580950.1 helix-turn-helix domain-containing protein [Prescottella equi]MBM4581431.1 helix-turn-helix domain-containing protein [Prescottella equi]MBM4581447.1 helix-turn-helix domain-containing protein [Prescottella equi]
MDINLLNEMIGDEVRVARARRKVSRAALADLTGLSAKTIQRIENGERPADVSQMAIICEALEESITELMGRAVARVED